LGGGDKEGMWTLDGHPLSSLITPRKTDSVLKEAEDDELARKMDLINEQQYIRKTLPKSQPKKVFFFFRLFFQA
jgi:hypothetical protein